MGGLPAFDRYIGIDYSGAETPKSSLKGLRVYMADRNGPPTEVPPGSVAKSTHAGLPWLRHIRLHVPTVHFWPFDGWDVPAGRSVVAEVYPSLCSRGFARRDRNEHQHDAFSVAEWMRRSDLDGTLADLLAPALAPAEREAAYIEGWILGIK